MKLNIYLIRLVRRIEKTIGKKETMNVLGISRCTLHRWKNDYYGLSVDNLEHISKKYVDLFPDEDIKEVFMQGLVCLMEDRLKDQININNWLFLIILLNVFAYCFIAWYNYCITNKQQGKKQWLKTHTKSKITKNINQ